MADKRRKRILILYDHRAKGMVLAIEQHLKAIEQHSIDSHEIVYLNFASLAPNSGIDDPVAPPPAEILETKFDTVILHYRFLALRTTGQIFYKWREATDWIKKIRCPKIAIPMDEMDHAGLLDDWLFELETDAVFSVHYKPEGPLYPRTRTRAVMLNCLPGYIDEAAAREIAPTLKPHSQRNLDIVYRANHLPYWYGSHCQLKHLIGEEILIRAPAHGFITDISTNLHDVIYGKDWLNFLSSSRFTIGGEGGRTVVDYCGERKLQVDLLLRENSEATFEQIASRMPPGWDSERMLTITPRHFEAIVTKTAQLLLKGEYKGILVAERHYIPFQQDFSDLDTALDKLKDIRYCENLAECAYEEIYRSGRYSYSFFVKRIIEQINELETYYQRRKTMGRKNYREPHPTLDVLERELNAARYQNVLLNVQLRLAQEKIIELQSIKSKYQLLLKFEESISEYLPVSNVGIKVARLIRQAEIRPYRSSFLIGVSAATVIIIFLIIIFRLF